MVGGEYVRTREDTQDIRKKYDTQEIRKKQRTWNT